MRRALEGLGRREGVVLAAVLALAAVWLSPALHTPFRFDDIFNFEMRTGSFDAQGRTFGGYVTDALEAVFTQGRAQPLGVVLSVVPWVFSDAPTLYKLYLLLLTVGTLALLWRVVRRLGAPVATAALVVLLCAAFVQFHNYHDPVLDYLGVVQLGLGLALGSVLAWLRHDEAGGRRWLVAAVLLWLACLALYEVMVALTPFVVAVLWARRRSVRGTLRGSLPYTVPVAAGVLVLLAVRLTDDSGTAYYDPGGGIGATIETWGRIVLGAVPASYAVLDPWEHMGDPTAAELVAAVWRGAVAALAVVSLAVRPAAAPVLRGLALAGLALWLFSSAPIAISPKYQGELEAGLAYIPGLMATFGFGLLTAALATWGVQGARRRSRAAGAVAAGAAALVVGAAAGTTGFANLRVVADTQPTRETRNLFNDAVRHGILRDLPADATVIGYARDLAWYPANFSIDKITFDGVTADRSGRRYDMRVDATLPTEPCPRRPGAWPRQLCEAVGPVGGWLAVRPRHGGSNVAALAVAPRGRVADGRAPAVALVAYAEGDAAGRPPVLTGRLPDERPWNSRALPWRRVDHGDGWALWRTPVTGPRPMTSTVDPGGPVVFTAFSTGPQRARWLGTRHLLP
ncbi:MAG TPA: hypothetical protein VD931_03540 [Baekduia sp.]|nr:hypothetical protein [Baekduia sp.]